MAQIREVMCRWFSMRGFEVDVASDGFEAVEKCESVEYDLVLMDLEMPRMSGSEAIAILKEKHPMLPIVVLTGYTSEQNDTWRTQAARIFVKPISLRLLEEQIRLLLDCA